MCITQGMEALIKQAFLHVMELSDHVAEGHYDLIGPNGEIILPRVWEEIIQPDWSITMHMWPMEPVKPMAPPAGTGPGFPPPKPFPPTPADTTKIRSEWVPPPRRFPPPPPPNWPGQRPPASMPGRIPGSVDPSKPSAEKDMLLVKTINPSTKEQRKESHAKKPELDTDNLLSDDAGSLFGDADRRGPDRKPDKKEQMKTQVTKSSADTESLISDSIVSDEDIEREAARKLIRKLVRSRKIYRVGKMNRGKYHLTYQISPKKEGLLLLNEYGRKLINEVMKAKV